MSNRILKTCSYCKTEFLTNLDFQRFCKKDCSRAFNRDRQRRIVEESFKTGEYNGNGRWLKLRFLVFKRDNFTCQYCGRIAPDVKLHVDHLIPKSKGRNDSLGNLITACEDCNIGKGDVLLTREQEKRLQRRAGNASKTSPDQK